MSTRFRTRRIRRLHAWATLSVRRRWLKPKRNKTYAPDSRCKQALGRFAIFASEFADHPKSSTIRSSAGFFSLFLSILAFGVCDVLAQERHVIIHHDTALRSCPDPECKVVAQLPILSPVYAGSREKTSKPEYGEGLWTHVDTTQRSRASGWILDDRIGFPDRFHPVRNWRIKQFSYCLGDYCPEFRFTASGEFTARYRPCFDGLCSDPPIKAQCYSAMERREIIDGSVYCVSSGSLYRAGEAIRLGGVDSHEFMYFNDRNELCVDAYTCQAYQEKKP